MTNKCSQCGRKLEPVFPDIPHRRKDDNFVQYRDALAITLHGGYGMFFDPAPDPQVIFCKSCVENFLIANVRAIEEAITDSTPMYSSWAEVVTTIDGSETRVIENG